MDVKKESDMVKTIPSNEAHPPSRGRLHGVKNVIAVGSGKGGVGKSTVAVNLALTLRAMGASVALLDADIYGPSIPIMLGLRDAKPEMKDQRTIIPVEKFGIDTISMGYLLKEADAVVWRGPMLAKVLKQFIDDVDWGEKDFLIIDLPPGTGDIQLSLSQMIPVKGAVVVTTPQDVALADVRRAIRMFEVTKIPVVGVVENMAYFTCPDNGKDYYIFGEGRIAEACEEMELPLLGSFPLDMGVGPAADRGEPIVHSEPEGDQAGRYRQLMATIMESPVMHAQDDTNKNQFEDFFKGR
jgi:ATP-binding protein involved in chromosome partitioning